MENSSQNIPPLVCTGLGGLGVALICMIQACRSRIYGWWRYLIKPVLVLVCMVFLLGASEALSGNNLNPNDQVVMIFVTVFSAIAMLTVMFIPGPRRWPIPAGAAAEPAPAMAPPAPARRVNLRLNLRTPMRIPPLFSMLSGIFLIAAVVLTLGVAMNVPEAILDGVPNMSLNQQLSTYYFSGYPNWPALLMRLGSIGAMLLTFLSIVALGLDRRGRGVMPILTRIGGIVLVVTAASTVSFHPSAWMKIAEVINSAGGPHPAAVVANVLDGFERGPLLLAGALFCGGQILLNCCARKTVIPQDEPNRTAA